MAVGNAARPWGALTRSGGSELQSELMEFSLELGNLCGRDAIGKLNVRPNELDRNNGLRFGGFRLISRAFS